MTTSPCLQVKSLSIDIKQRHTYSRVVDQVSFNMHAGQCLGLVGESGSGKSMTALTTMQLLPSAAYVSQQSQVLLDGQDVLNYSQRRMRHIRGAQIGMIFQDASTALNPVKTIAEQLFEILFLHERLSKKAATQRALSLFDEVGLKQPKRCLSAYPHELSGGMRQRAMIAMALACRPSVLIADEPTTALDVTVQAQVITLLKELQQHHHMALLFISHDLSVVSQLADEVVVLKQGQVQEAASAQIFFTAPQHEYSKQLLQAVPDLMPQQTLQEKAGLLEVDQLRVYFPIKKGLLQRTVDHVKAVESVSFSLNQGQTLAIVGESGSGKTTVAKALVNLVNHQGGCIDWSDSLGADVSLSSIVQMVFQDPYAALNPRMRILDCLMEGVLVQDRSMKHRDQVMLADELLEQVRLPFDAKWAFPHEFSGGERQRLCIARALALHPACLILDEPTSSLDVSIQQQILQLLMEIQVDRGVSYILITHHLSVVAAMAHSVMVMHQGHSVEQGSVESILTQPQQDYTQQLLRAVPQRPQASETQAKVE